MAVRDEDSLSDYDIMRLSLLNRKLEEAQQWISEQADRCFKDYFAAGGRHRHHHDDD